MPIRFLLSSAVFTSIFLPCSIILSCFPGSVSSAVVTLKSIEIFKTHEWLKTKPTVYFQCQGENKTVLPDVKEPHVFYTFKGEESWQPLTKLSNKKCKRCGFYERDIIKSDDVFDEWELCPSDFSDAHGIYVRVKAQEFNATFLCPDCVPLENASNHTSESHNGGKGMHVLIVVMISALVSMVSILGAVAAFKYWQKRKREQEQARFLKLFDDGDDIEDELGLGHVI
ncbi:uncharacterized protein LOC131160367 [Malania oleifera]|uniref:uncharacterized protein LOC131160367 n=1 Tax=Malania oleifera TaxID=397392 RepID=UPI0025ADCF6D|nr:uncharacterized protein LOC131160367 [Malania oleifera]